MSKEELKNIVSEILGNSDDSTFSQFIRKIASSIKGNQALKLDGIGHFQIKKEPLSRMERKMEGSISEKEILLFLPEGKLREDNIISIEIEEESEISDEFNESVFDVSINRPTIISDTEQELPTDDNLTVNETLSNKITEFVESGEIIEGYQLLDETNIDAIPTSDAEIINDEELLTDNSVIENSGQSYTEARISKEFMNYDIEDESIEDNEYEVTSSNIENDRAEEEPPASDEKETDITADEIEIAEKEDINPFDELDNYIKDETKDEAQEIIDAEPEMIDDTKKGLGKRTQVSDSSEIDEKSSEITEPKSKKWYKNPILYLAAISFIAANIVLYIVLSTDSKTNIESQVNSSEANVVDNMENQLGIVDTVADTISTSRDLTDEIIPEETTKKELVEVEKTDDDTPVIKNNIRKKEIAQQKAKNVQTGLYRDIKNDRTITQRIYFDGERYTVQSSSWRSTSIAEREVNKLRERGFDAFIYKVFIESKNGTWNRVRIGYFNTQKEAEEFLRNNKI